MISARSGGINQISVIFIRPGFDSDDSDNSEDDPERLWCVCREPHNNRFMICCDKCEDWFHGKCVGVTRGMGRELELKGLEWICPRCVRQEYASLYDTIIPQEVQHRSNSFVPFLKVRDNDEPMCFSGSNRGRETGRSSGGETRGQSGSVVVVVEAVRESGKNAGQNGDQISDQDADVYGSKNPRQFQQQQQRGYGASALRRHRMQERRPRQQRLLQRRLHRYSRARIAHRHEQRENEAGETVE